MSLYLGKDNVGKSVLHTTRTSLGESVMKAGVNEYTTFHSSLPYVQLVKRITVPHHKVDIFYGKYYYCEFFISLPDEVITLVNSGHLFTIVVSTKNSGGQRVGVNNQSLFLGQKGISPSSIESFPAYTWYSSLSTGASRSTTASTTYKYLNIDRSDAGVLYNGYWDGAIDVIYTAEIVFYNIINKNINIKNNVIEIILSPS